MRYTLVAGRLDRKREMGPASACQKVRRQIVFVDTMADDHDAALLPVIEAPDNRRMKFFDRAFQLIRVPGSGDVVWVVDNNDVAAETGNGAVKGGRVQPATGRGRKIG